MRAPIACWNCGAQNDLDTAQTCSACGAPLVKSRSVFSKPVLFGVVALFMLLQAYCFFLSRVHPR
jgi:predicted amidophosphoribosyltransferase